MRIEKLTLIAVLAALCVMHQPARAEESVILRTSVTPEEAWIGQRVLLQIDVLGKDGWAQIKRLGALEIPGVYVMRTESHGTRIQETIGGISYSGQRYELSLYPQKSGALEVPAHSVLVSIKMWGVDAKEVEHKVITPAATFRCTVPPGTEGIRGLISTTYLSANQTWEPEPDDPKVGDAIKRTITLRATDVSGMAFSPMQHPGIEGLGIYPGEPAVDDRSARGALTGTLVETVTYVFERPGELEIPGVEVPWWDVGALELKRIELPGLALRVTGNSATPSATASATEGQDRRRVQGWAWGLGAAAATVLLGFLLRGRVTNWWKNIRKTRSEAETRYFGVLVKSLRSGDPKAVLRDAMRWIDRINEDSSPGRLDRFLQQYGDAQVQEAAARLTGCLSPGKKSCDLSTLGRGLAKARTRWRRTRGRKHLNNVLPDLNRPRTSQV